MSNQGPGANSAVQGGQQPAWARQPGQMRPMGGPAQMGGQANPMVGGGLPAGGPSAGGPMGGDVMGPHGGMGGTQQMSGPTPMNGDNGMGQMGPGQTNMAPGGGQQMSGPTPIGGGMGANPGGPANFGAGRQAVYNERFGEGAWQSRFGGGNPMGGGPQMSGPTPINGGPNMMAQQADPNPMAGGRVGMNAPAGGSLQNSMGVQGGPMGGQMMMPNAGGSLQQNMMRGPMAGRPMMNRMVGR